MTPSLALCTLLALTSASEPHVTALRHLSAKQFKTRETASRWLLQEMPRTRLIVLMGTASDDAETRRRCHAVLIEHEAAWWRDAIPRDGRWPHADMIDPCRYGGELAKVQPPLLPDLLGYHDRVSLFNALYSDAMNLASIEDCGPDYWQYRGASYLYAAKLKARGHKAKDVRDFLEGLVPLEKKWYAGANIQRP